MYRPAFNNVKLVLIFVVALGLLAGALRSRIPPTINNGLGESNDDFLRRAGTQPVDWKFLSADTIAEARRTGKPILLEVGLSASAIAWQLDKSFFSDIEIAGYLNLNYLCIRVDGLDEPAWLNAFLPLSRRLIPFQSGCQIWVLEPSGHLIDYLDVSDFGDSVSKDQLLDRVVTLRDEFEQVDAGKRRSSGSASQQEDVRLVAAGAVPSGYLESVRSRIGKHGGFPWQGKQALYPGAWSYLLETGSTGELHQSLDPLLRSPMFDLIDGGFFRVSHDEDFSSVEFNKSSIQNAEMLVLLTRLTLADHSPVNRFLTAETKKWVQLAADAQKGAAAFEVEDKIGSGRNDRYSFSVARLRSILDGDERDFAARNLGLDVMASTQMTACLTSPDAIGDPRLTSVLSKLRAAEHDSPNLRQPGYLEVEASLDARLVEAARLAGDKSEIVGAVSRCSRLSRFMTQRGLLRRPPDTDPGDLGDYLAYSDAMLECFLATGRPSWLDQGRKQLRDAVRIFASPSPGCYVLSSDRSPLPDVEVPELMDGVGESCSARISRLCLAYGRLYRSRDLTRRAHSVAVRLAGLAAGPEGGYLNLAAVADADPTYAIATGPDAVALAQQVQRLRPSRFCAPAIAARRRPGVYVIGKRVAGPLSVSQAAALLPPNLRPADQS